ncbi:group 1 mite allergen-like protein [Dermatophagoides farinae]|uniref:Group 1 mite allergen-like protein n=1 Tax=Dermatophagoides farinae TaxID=6954 RepID=A0A9D4P5C1_DERFA|nr:group 1 mite allergen-like protein [Dermatophagoides farinae]
MSLCRSSLLLFYFCLVITIYKVRTQLNNENYHSTLRSVIENMDFNQLSDNGFRDDIKQLTAVDPDDLNDCYDSSFGERHLNITNMDLIRIIEGYFNTPEQMQLLSMELLNDNQKIHQLLQKRFEILAKNILQLAKEILKCLESPKEKRSRLGITSISHLSAEEFQSLLDNQLYDSMMKAMRQNQIIIIIKIENAFPTHPNLQIPMDYNWADHNAVTPIRHQHKCGSCAVFSAVATVEILDCLPYGICQRGSLIDQSWKVIKQNGITTEKERPYLAQQTGQCNRNPESPVSIRNAPESMRHLKGPFLDYCGQVPNHAIVMVGWTQKYWIIKNSWGEKWNQRISLSTTWPE